MDIPLPQGQEIGYVADVIIDAMLDVSVKTRAK
jgi:hypothetical protein